MNSFRIHAPGKYKAYVRRIRLRKIKELVLGREYDLSTVLADDKEMRRAEELVCHKQPANVLSFAYSKNSGEILLNVPFIRREAKTLGSPLKKRLTYLYIHALLHLKGYDHKKLKDERKMLKAEKRYMTKSGF